MNKIVITENTENIARLPLRIIAEFCIFHSSDQLSLDTASSVLVSDNVVRFKYKNLHRSFFYSDYISHAVNPVVNLPLCARVKIEAIVDK